MHSVPLCLDSTSSLVPEIAVFGGKILEMKVKSSQFNLKWNTAYSPSQPGLTWQLILAMATDKHSHFSEQSLGYERVVKLNRVGPCVNVSLFELHFFISYFIEVACEIGLELVQCNRYVLHSFPFILFFQNCTTTRHILVQSMWTWLRIRFVLRLWRQWSATMVKRRNNYCDTDHIQIRKSFVCVILMFYIWV